MRQRLVESQDRKAQSPFGTPAVERVAAALESLDDSLHERVMNHVVVQIDAADRELRPDKPRAQAHNREQYR